MVLFIKGIISAYVTAKEFETNMNIMDSSRKNKEEYSVKITLDQMNILTTCASLGVSSSEDIVEFYEDSRAIANSRNLHPKKA